MSRDFRSTRESTGLSPGKGPKALTLANAFGKGEQEHNDFLQMTELEKHRFRRNVDARIIQSLKDRDDAQKFRFSDVLSYLGGGVNVVYQDDFSRCFRKEIPSPWNFNWYLMLAWILGCAFRYLILFPLRLIICVLGTGLGIIGIWITGQVLKKDPEQRRKIELWFIMLIANTFVVSWTGVINYHGVLPPKRAHQIYVANHSTMSDVIFLLALRPFCLVGQAHPTKKLVHYFQQTVLKSLNCIWFDRKTKNDRDAVKRKLIEHIADPKNPRLILFPEGTCVNNEYCVQFKRGAFSLGDDVEICPVAIKYNKIFSDPYWVSRDQPFHYHILELMMSWAVVADIWFLPPQKRKHDETVDQFAARVKKLIADTSGLKDVQWNGYLKHYKPSERVIREKKRLFKKRLERKFPNLDDLVEKYGSMDDEDDLPSGLRQRNVDL